MLAVRSLRSVQRARFQDSGLLSSRLNGVMISAARFALGKLSHRRWLLIACLTALLVTATAAPSLSSPAFVRSFREGLWGLAFLGTFLSLWLLGFWMATRRIPQGGSKHGDIARGGLLAHAALPRRLRRSVRRAPGVDRGDLGRHQDPGFS